MPNLVSRRLAVFALACTFLAAALPVSAETPVRHVAAPAPDVTALLRIAQIKVNATPGFSRALFRSATGTVSGGGNTTTAQGINTWAFVYDNSPTPKAVNPSATLSFAAGAFGKVTPGSALGIGVADIRTLPLMTLAHAVQLLHKSGVTSAFTTVTLHAIPGPGGTDPIYNFALVDGGASVDTITGEVIAFRPL